MISALPKLKENTKKTVTKLSNDPKQEGINYHISSVQLFGETFLVKKVYLANHEDGYRVGWVMDNQSTNCMRCNVSFGLLKWRHHCRLCGYVMCNSCSSLRLQLNSLKKFENFSRVCAVCYTTYVQPANDRATTASCSILDLSSDQQEFIHQLRRESGALTAPPIRSSITSRAEVSIDEQPVDGSNAEESLVYEEIHPPSIHNSSDECTYSLSPEDRMKISKVATAATDKALIAVSGSPHPSIADSLTYSTYIAETVISTPLVTSNGHFSRVNESISICNSTEDDEYYSDACTQEEYEILAGLDAMNLDTESVENGRSFSLLSSALATPKVHSSIPDSMPTISPLTCSPKRDICDTPSPVPVSQDGSRPGITAKRAERFEKMARTTQNSTCQSKKKLLSPEQVVPSGIVASLLASHASNHLKNIETSSTIAKEFNGTPDFEVIDASSSSNCLTTLDEVPSGIVANVLASCVGDQLRRSFGAAQSRSSPEKVLQQVNGETSEATKQTISDYDKADINLSRELTQTGTDENPRLPPLSPSPRRHGKTRKVSRGIGSIRSPKVQSDLMTSSMTTIGNIQRSYCDEDRTGAMSIRITRKSLIARQEQATVQSPLQQSKVQNSLTPTRQQWAYKREQVLVELKQQKQKSPVASSKEEKQISLREHNVYGTDSDDDELDLDRTGHRHFSRRKHADFIAETVAYFSEGDSEYALLRKTNTLEAMRRHTPQEKAFVRRLRAQRRMLRQSPINAGNLLTGKNSAEEQYAALRKKQKEHSARVTILEENRKQWAELNAVQPLITDADGIADAGPDIDPRIVALTVGHPKESSADAALDMLASITDHLIEREEVNEDETKNKEETKCKSNEPSALVQNCPEYDKENNSLSPNMLEPSAVTTRSKHQKKYDADNSDMENSNVSIEVGLPKLRNKRASHHVLRESVPLRCVQSAADKKEMLHPSHLHQQSFRKSKSFRLKSP